jgi:hypothetical protein
MMAAVSLGIVFLMTVKPDLFGSLATVVVAALAGWLSALVSGQRYHAPQPAPATSFVSSGESA